MLNIGQDIHSLTDFKRRTSELVAQLHETKRPIVLTVNGRPAVVVQEAEAYQELLNRLAELANPKGVLKSHAARGRE